MKIQNKSIKRLQKIGISTEIAEKLIEKEIFSSVQLANMPTPQAKRLLGDFGLGDDEIRGILKRARTLKAVVDNHLAMVSGQVSPHYKALASTNESNNIINFHEGLESYDEMFSSDQFATTTEFNSVLSPAAYLVDLMRYIDEYIEQPTDPEDKALLLKSRRPDIWNIPLDEENTLDEIPYLELVNEILRTKLDSDYKINADGTISEEKIEDALLYMAETVFPLDLPFNAPLEKIRKYLEALKTELYEVYETFGIDPAAQTREYLKITPEQTTYVTTPSAYAESLNLAYGNIQTNNSDPHFTGISNGYLGGLNNAEIFMNQVGLTDTDELKALVYQNIDTELPGSNDLLNQLFINKKSTENGNQYHLMYSPAPVIGPDWAGTKAWSDPYYKTIQQVILNGQLYLIVRTKDGIDIWNYNSSHRHWSQVQVKNRPNWSDANGWDKPECYSTIQTVVADQKIYLLGRSPDGMDAWMFDTEANEENWTQLKPVGVKKWSDDNGWNNSDCYSTIQAGVVSPPLKSSYIVLVGRSPQGIQTHILDTETNEWDLVGVNVPDWSDANKWNVPECYSTIQLAVANNIPYLLGRSSTGIEVFHIDPTKPFTEWKEIKSQAVPDWSDANGWNVPECYEMIQTAVVDFQLYLIGRSPNGIQTFKMEVTNNIPIGWLPISPESSPAWTGSEWTDPSNYQTIQTAVVDKKLYLLGRSNQGIETYLLENPLGPWKQVGESNNPPWTNAGWSKPENYTTIQTAVINKNLLLLGRSSNGIETWLLDQTTNNWTQIQSDIPAWADESGWGDPSYYTTIQTASPKDELLLFGCTETNIDTWRFSTAKQIWKKEKLIKAVLQLENNSSNVPLGLGVLDLINRFIRLANIIGWSYEDLDWALSTLKVEDITNQSISELKNTKWIMDNLNLNAPKTTAFWHDVKTSGQGTGKISQSLFDEIFNEPTLFTQKILGTNDNSAQPEPLNFLRSYHPDYKLNPNYTDEILNWNPGNTSTESDNAIAVRLMGALNLDAENLKALTNYFKDSALYNTAGEIELTVPNLSALYRFALLANSLKLSINELITLLEFLQISLSENFTFSGEEIIEVINLSNWIKENQLNVYQLDYITNDVTSKSINTGFDLKTVPTLLKNLSDAVGNWILSAKQLQFRPLITEPLSKTFYNTLASKNFIDDRGIILKNGFEFTDISNLIRCEEIEFAPQNELISIFSAGKTEEKTASQIVVPSVAGNSSKITTALKSGSVSVWFKYTKNQKGTSTIFSLENKSNTPANITKIQIQDANIKLFSETAQAKTIGKLADKTDWHFLVISYKENKISLDGKPLKVTGLNLKIPVKDQCILSIGDRSDSILTEVADLRIFDSMATVAEINKELYPKNENSPDIPKGNTNYWPLNEGQGIETAKDLAGDINGRYEGNAVWNLTYNADIPVTSLENGSLSKSFDPANPEASASAVQLWQTIVKLRNILNKVSSNQKKGTLQKLSDFFQTKNKLGIYADFISKKDKFPRYIQTLLAFRFSLNWSEFKLSLTNSTPFISDNLVLQFQSNKIDIAANAEITRLKDENQNPVNQWLISSDNTVFFLNNREESLDVYKLLPVDKPDVFFIDPTFKAGDKYEKFGIDENLGQNLKDEESKIFPSNQDNQICVVQRKGSYAHLTIYSQPITNFNNVITEINDFINDLGQLLYTAKTLKLTDEEFECIVDNPKRFFDSTVSDTSNFNLSQLQSILLFRNLNNKYKQEDMSFADYFYLADDRDSLENYIAKLTGWDPQGLRLLSEWSGKFQEFQEIDNLKGAAVDASSNYAVIGTPSKQTVSVYELKGEKWERLPLIKQVAGESNFGVSVAVQYKPQNETVPQKQSLQVIIGDTSADNGNGQVSIYDYNFLEKKWNKPVVLKAPGQLKAQSFGTEISISENILAVGASKAGNNGEVYLFEFVNDNWKQKSVTGLSAENTDQSFGNSISLSENIIAVGSEKNGYIFNVFKDQAKLVGDAIPCSSSAKVATNGSIVVISGGDSIQYVTDVDTDEPSEPLELNNEDFKGHFTIALEDDTLIVCDSANTCFVYYIQDNKLTFSDSFPLISPTENKAVTAQALPIALNAGNLVISNNSSQNVLFYGIKHNVDWFGFAEECFALTDKLGVSIGFLLGFIKLSDLGLNIIKPSHNSDIFNEIKGYASKLENALKLGRSPDEWNAAYDPLQSKFLEKERDALVGYMLFHLRNAFADITNLNDLYELLLIDVASSGCRSISRIKAALNSLQLYIERCRMNLEPHVTIEGSSNGESDSINSADVEWSWMSHYRIWEANREVFLFPENYYDPTLRKDKSTAYGDLQNKLSQGNLTDETAEEALKAYFHDLEDLTNLEIVSCCLGRVPSFVNGNIIIKNTYFIFAKTKHRNEGFYYRTADAVLPSDSPDKWTNWSNWKKIKANIKADRVLSIYASGKPFLFWTEVSKQKITTGTTNAKPDKSQFGTNKSYKYEFKLYYSFQNSNGTWSNPHEVPDPTNIFEFKVIPDNSQTPLEVDYDELILVNNSYLDIAFFIVRVAATGGNVEGGNVDHLTSGTYIDQIINIHERYIWYFDGNAESSTGNYPPLNPSNSNPPGVTYPQGNGIFNRKQVLQLSSYKGGLKLPNHFNSWFNDSFTFGIWIKAEFPTGTDNTSQKGDWPIIVSEENSAPNTIFNLQIINGKPWFGVMPHGFYGNTRLPDNVWNFVVFRYDKKTGSQAIFVNGVLDKLEYNALTIDAGKQIFFGSNGDKFFANGQMADMFTVNTAMSDAEIYSIYEQYIGYEISGDVENYEWELNSDFRDTQGKNQLLPNELGFTFTEGNKQFAGRKVLSIEGDKQGYMQLPPTKFDNFFTGDFTIGMWINPDSPDGTPNPILGSNVPGGEDSLEGIFLGVDKDQIPYISLDNTHFEKGNTALTGKIWSFLVFTFDSKLKTAKVFLNGSDITTTPQNVFKLLENPIDLFLGTSGDQFFAGQIADLFVANANLDSNSIKKIYDDYLNKSPISISAGEHYLWQLEGTFENENNAADNQSLIAPGLNFETVSTGTFSGRNYLTLVGSKQSYLSLPENFNNFFNNSFSIGIWIKGDFSGSGDWPILASSEPIPNESIRLLIENGKANFGIDEKPTVGNILLNPNQWYFLVCTYDKDSQIQNIYVNGNLDASSTGHTSYEGSSGVILGYFNEQFTTGAMANLLLVDKALSADEIMAVYNRNFTPFPNSPAILNEIQTENGRRIQRFNQNLFTGGADYLFSKNSLSIKESDLSSQAAYGRYLWELFYHVPLLIGQLLSGNQKFEDAKKWYEYIYNPTAPDKSGDRFWQLGYFRSLGKPEDIVEILTDNTQKDKEQIILYDLDPFDPEAISYLRPGAFEKKIVMNYIRNLLDWGDNLFSQYTWETITQAEMLYVLAKELLGKEPEISGTFFEKPSMTIADIEKEYPNEIPQFVIDIEDMYNGVGEDVQNTPALSASVSNFYFGIPENSELPANYDLVDKRLYEIRHCLNILGREQSLALFQPPVDPMALVAAGAEGLSIADVPISTVGDIPHYRFARMIESAKGFCQRVIDFGRQILSALEKNDAEALVLLRSVQEKTILDLTTSIREKEIEDAMNQALVLEQSLAGANERLNYYTTLLETPVSALEQAALALMAVAIAEEIPAAGFHTASAIGYMIPTVFGFADGDFNPGGAIEAGASVASTLSNISNNSANMTNTSASYSRRAEDWGLQKKLAKYDVDSISVQKAINDIRLQNAQAQLKVHNQTITNNESLQNFYSDKFSNKDLYQWMIGQISSIYYQAYQMAFDLAKKAEIAYQFELNTNDNIITYGYWDSSRKGLLAGEKLASDLDRLEKAYLDNNVRRLEIQKIVSLKDLLGETNFNGVKSKGKFKFSLTEKLFDLDFPGHFDRRIKSITITIPAIVGPYQTIKATLSQLSNKVVTQPDLNTIKYLLDGGHEAQPATNTLRVNWRPNQQIAISKASGDTGLFELNFNDARYLPFEGTGVVSDWELNIPTSTNKGSVIESISDIIIYIDYTALDGGSEFSQQVLESIK